MFSQFTLWFPVQAVELSDGIGLGRSQAAPSVTTKQTLSVSAQDAHITIISALFLPIFFPVFEAVCPILLFWLFYITMSNRFFVVVRRSDRLKSTLSLFYPCCFGKHHYLSRFIPLRVPLNPMENHEHINNKLSKSPSLRTLLTIDNPPIGQGTASDIATWAEEIPVAG